MYIEHNADNDAVVFGVEKTRMVRLM